MQNYGFYLKGKKIKGNLFFFSTMKRGTPETNDKQHYAPGKQCYPCTVLIHRRPP